MQFTEEHDQLRDTVLKFVEREINPHIDQWERERTFPAHALFKQMGDLGLLGVSKPEEFGGMGLDYTYSLVMAEALGTIDGGGVPMAIGVQTDMCTPALAKFGSDALRREFLEPAIAGDAVGCVGVSEPSAGSDVAAIKTTAKKVGGDWVIRGGKMWITNGMQADWMCCLVNTSDDPPHKNKSLIMVPMDAKGVQRARKLEKLGMHSSDTAQIFLDDVKVPVGNVIGQPGMGFMLQMIQFQEERLWAGANAVQGMLKVIALTQAYTRERQAFGRSILDNQWVHYKLAELSTEVECLRALVWAAAEQYIAGKDVTRLASMAKLKAGKLSREVADTCLQFWGGMGYMEGSPVARFYRDGRLCSIGGGADEIMLSIICKLDGTLPRRAKGAKG